MKKVCVLLENDIRYDNRVRKIVQSLSQYAKVDLYYLGPEHKDLDFFNDNVELFAIDKRLGLREKVLRHSYFFAEFAYTAQAVLKTGRKYDIIYANDLPNLTPGLILKRKIGGVLVYDSHEIFLETLNQTLPQKAKGLKGWVFKNMLAFMRSSGKRAEAKMLKEVDYFITVNQSLANYFKQQYAYPNEIHVVMNCPMLQEQVHTKFDYRKKFDWPSTTRVAIFQGTLNEGRGLHLLLDAAKNLPANIKLVIVGDGPLMPSMKSKVEQLGLQQQVKFTGRIKGNEIIGSAMAADFGINLLEPINLSKKYTTATKMFEYIHAGIPSVCSDIAENVRILDKYKVGILTPNTVKDIEASIVQMADEFQNPAFAAACEQAKQEYNWERQTAELLPILK